MKTITVIDHALHVEANVVRQIRRVHLQLTGSLTFDLQSDKMLKFLTKQKRRSPDEVIRLPFSL